MKKYIWMVLLMLLLCGCAAEETYETLSDDLVHPVMAQQRSISVELPGEAAMPAMESDAGRIYLCEAYEIAIQTMAAGDINATVQALSGHDKAQLTVLETEHDGCTRYEFVWAAAGESGDRIGRSVILDDGNYHYTMSVLRNADPTEVSQISWDQVFQSFQLS